MRAKNKTRIRLQIAAEAARMIASNEATSIDRARYKAAIKLGYTDRHLWPDTAGIESAVREYQQLFLSHRQPEALEKSRKLAISAMQAFAQFHPRLTGAVLEGFADENSRVEILLTAETPEDVLFALGDQHIPWREEDIWLTFPDKQRHCRPCYHFVAEDIGVALIILRPEDKSSPPIDAETGKPLAAANLAQVISLPGQVHDYP